MIRYLQCQGHTHLCYECGYAWTPGYPGSNHCPRCGFDSLRNWR